MNDREYKISIQSLLSYWKTLLAIALVILAVTMELFFIWGIFFGFWAVETLRTGEAYFVERVNKVDEPLLYWLIIIIWISMSGYYFFFDENVHSFLYQIIF